MVYLTTSFRYLAVAEVNSSTRTTMGYMELSASSLGLLSHKTDTSKCPLQSLDPGR